MINIKKAEEEFKKYLREYNINEPNILLKVRHTFRVKEICKDIATSLNLSEDKIKLAELIGLLHDIARFEQYTRYATFSDIHSIDHGDLGVEILEENDYIKKYIKNDKYVEIIKKAIKNHNKYSIEGNLNKETEMFCKIIRDADKLDILYQATFELYESRKSNIEEQIISPKVLEQFLDGKIINRENVENDINKIIVNIAFIYDFYFKETYKIIKDNNYIDKIIDRFKFKNEETIRQIELIRRLANDYIHKNIQ